MILISLFIPFFSVFVEAQELNLASNEEALKSHVQVASEVTVGLKEKVTLFDIAAVEGAETSLLQIMNEIVVLPLAQVGENEISSSELAAKIRRRLSGYKLSLPSRLKVMMQSEVLNRSEIERKIRNQLGQICNDCEISVSSLQLPQVRHSNCELDYSKLSLRSSFMLPLIESSNTSSQLKWVTGQIRIFKKVPTLVRSVMQGQRLQPEDVQVLKMDVTHLQDPNLTLEEVIGQMTQRGMNANTALSRADLRREAVIKRGQMIKALVGSEDFEISVNVTAEENGFVGDMIKVKNLETNKVMSGLVTDKSMVRIQ